MSGLEPTSELQHEDRRTREGGAQVVAGAPGELAGQDAATAAEAEGEGALLPAELTAEAPVAGEARVGRHDVGLEGEHHLLVLRVVQLEAEAARSPTRETGLGEHVGEVPPAQAEPAADLGVAPAVTPEERPPVELHPGQAGEGGHPRVGADGGEDEAFDRPALARLECVVFEGLLQPPLELLLLLEADACDDLEDLREQGPALLRRQLDAVGEGGLNGRLDLGTQVHVDDERGGGGERPGLRGGLLDHHRLGRRGADVLAVLGADVAVGQAARVAHRRGLGALRRRRGRDGLLAGQAVVVALGLAGDPGVVVGLGAGRLAQVGLRVALGGGRAVGAGRVGQVGGEGIDGQSRRDAENADGRRHGASDEVDEVDDAVLAEGVHGAKAFHLVRARLRLGVVDSAFLRAILVS